MPWPRTTLRPGLAAAERRRPAATGSAPRSRRRPCSGCRGTRTAGRDDDRQEDDERPRRRGTRRCQAPVAPSRRRPVGGWRRLDAVGCAVMGSDDAAADRRATPGHAARSVPRRGTLRCVGGRAELVGLALRLDEDAAVAAGRDADADERLVGRRGRASRTGRALRPAEHGEQHERRSRTRAPDDRADDRRLAAVDVEDLGGEQAADAEHRDEAEQRAASATRRRCRSRCGARRGSRRGCRRRGP